MIGISDDMVSMSSSDPWSVSFADKLDRVNQLNIEIAQLGREYVH